MIKRNQRHDILLEFRCPDRWLVRAAIEPTVVNETMLKQLKVDPRSKSPDHPCKSVFSSVEKAKKYDSDGH